MMRWIVASSLRFRYLVIALGVGLLVFGAQQIRGMPAEAFPEFAPPRVEVQTICLGLNATEVEGLVSSPLEESLTGLAGLDVIRSKSVPQLSSIELRFKPGTDLLHARQLVQERVEAATPSLPTWAAPPVILPAVSSTARVMAIGITSKTLPITALSSTAYWKVRARLLRVPGIANVSIWGEHLEQLHVQVDPVRMQQHGVTLEQAMTATSDAFDVGLLGFADGNRIGAGGYVETPNQRLAVEHVLSIVTPEDLARVPVAVQDGETVRLADVANVLTDTQPLVGDAVVNGGPGLLLIVEKYPWGNTLDITHDVESTLREIQPGLPGIAFDTHIFRTADFIDTSIHNLERAMLIGGLLIVFVLVAFLFEWRAAVISLVAMPLSVVAALVVLHARGETINVMVLAGLVISLGVVVDDAIIDIENIWRRLRRNHIDGARRSKTQVVLEASLEVRGPIVYASLIIVVALVPVFLLQGLTGTFFRPLVLSYGLAVIASLAVALTVTPALSVILLARGPLERKEAPLVRVLKRSYAGLLSRVVHRPRWAYLAAGVTAVAGIASAPFLGQSLIPEFKERSLLVHAVTKPGTSLDEERRVATRMNKALTEVPGVEHAGAHLGQAFLADEVGGVNFGEHWVTIDRSADYERTRDAIEESVDKFPGTYHEAQTYLNERIDEVLAGSGHPIVVRIFGSDLGLLRRKAGEVRDSLAKIDSVSDPQVELQEDVPQLAVKVDLAAARRYGIKPGDVRRAAATLIESEEVGDIFRGGRSYDVQVWSTPATRNSVASVRALPIDTPDGGRVLLGRVASVKLVPLPNEVRHENSSRSIDVVAGVDGGNLGSTVDAVEDALDSIRLPLGYHTAMLGEFRERQKAQDRLLRYGIGAAIAIFLLLQAAFKSWGLATLSFVTLPIALVGGALAAWLGGGILSLGSLVGFYTVFGIAARNGILLINHFQHLERDEGETFGAGLVLRGAQERLTPILMTTLATGLALVPLIVSGNAPGHEIEHPLAVVVVGGLVTSTLLNLFVVPSLYLRFARPAR